MSQSAAKELNAQDISEPQADAESLITEHLDLWTSAITSRNSTGRGSNKKIELYGIKKLRELILELAVRGKLVPQDPNNEPASELLKQVEEEKARLVREEKIKKPRKLPKVSVEDSPFSLPNGWEWERLGNILNVLNGRAYKKHEMLKTGTPLLRVGNLFTSKEWYYSDLELEPEKYIDSGDLIYAWSASFGPFIWNGGKAIYHYHIWRLDIFRGDLTTKGYLYNYLSEVTESIKASGNGIAMIHMTKDKMELLPIPVCPVEEQCRIVAKVDELMALCDHLENQTEQSLDAHATLADTLLDALTQAQSAEELAENWQRLEQNWDLLFPASIAGERAIDKLKQTILQLAVMGKLVPQDPNDEPARELLKRIKEEKERLIKEKVIKKQKPLPPISDDEKSFELPEGWEWCRTDDFCEGITSGSTPPKTEFSEVEGVPYLKVYNIRSQNIDFYYRPQYISDGYHKNKLSKSRLFPGDVVMNIVGPPLGKVAIVPDTFPEWNCNQAIVFFRPIEKALNRYLYLYIQAGTFLDSIELIGTAGQDNISVTKSRSMLIPLPPLREQEAIAERVDKLLSLCDELKERLQDAQKDQKDFTTTVVRQAVD
ncbi:restriction endonuclease subunit S [Marinimicrobium sp. C2-29]|uniref:restriction endonuclease subunit S n=1 Tax=Marinimicrobium sp. C2-29 TaxID=3139825 RepID=UPI00313879CD